MNKAKPITAAGRRRVRDAMAKFGMLLIRGQHELPSIADLLEGSPITTRGYSWDYVPAWNTTDEMLDSQACISLKLFKGMSTIVARDWWTVVDAIAMRNLDLTLEGRATPPVRELVSVVCREPGLSGAELKKKLVLTGKAGSRAFGRHKAKAESLLCIVPRAQESESHTHDAAWFPWSAARPVGSAEQDVLSLDEATRRLHEFAIELGGHKPLQMFPALGLANGS